MPSSIFVPVCAEMQWFVATFAKSLKAAAKMYYCDTSSAVFSSLCCGGEGVLNPQSILLFDRR